MYIRSTVAGTAAGLFNTIQANASVSSLTISGVDIQSVGNTGALAGTSSGTITSVSSSGSLYLVYSQSTAVYYLGGLIGQVSAGTVTSSSSSATAGATYTETSTSYSFGSSLGGLIGYMASGTTLTSSYATGNVSGNLGTYATGGSYGALVGKVTSATVTQSYSTGDITYSGNGTNQVGMIGYATSATISKCYSKGTYGLASSGGYIRYPYLGGIAGYISGGSIANSYSMITITMAQYYPVNGGNAGGLVGYVVSSPTITNSYAASPSMGTFAAGTIKGFSGTTLSSGVTNSYLYDNASVPSDTSTGVTSFTTTGQMESSSNFTGFDFSTVWNMPTANSGSPHGTPLLSPVLIWQCGTLGITCSGLRERTRAYQQE
jgi:hypothetical protein